MLSSLRDVSDRVSICNIAREIMAATWFLFFLLLTCVILDGQSQFIQNLKDKIKKVVSGGRDRHTMVYTSEEMMLFPNIGFQRKDGYWRVNVHGWRFRTSKRNKFFGESSSSLAERLARLFASSEQIVYFNDSFQRDRLKPFLVQDKANEEIFIQMGLNHNFTTTTDTEGQFRTSFILNNDHIQEMKETLKNDQVLTYHAVGDNFDRWKGTIHLLERRGLSIVSDIDDTIKISEVLDKIRLVANTFIHGFRVVEGNHRRIRRVIEKERETCLGMPEVYRGWRERYNCSFHYLSAMPDQLYAVTKDFIDDHQFPDGSFHMR